VPKRLARPQTAGAAAGGSSPSRLRAPRVHRAPKQRLVELKELLDGGLITQSEFEAKRGAILAEI
jgi:hypothetical protein